MRFPGPGAATLAAAATLVGGAAGCGKGNLLREHETKTASAATTATHPPPQPARSSARRDPSAERPPAKLTKTPTRAQAARFSRAVNLQLVDLPGARTSKRSPDRPSADEARECTGVETSEKATIGGLESPRFTRGKGLAREVISSGVAVLSSEGRARQDLLSVTSAAGLKCYAKLIRHSLGREEDGLRLESLHVARLQVPVAAAVHGVGIRISVRIRSTKSNISIPLFIDALVFVHQAAEIELYASSYVQPEPARTEQELLALMEQRARLATL